MRERRNRPEALCETALHELGLVPTKQGWPDFLAFDDDGNLVRVVEVKPRPGSLLKPSQVKVMLALQKLGVNVQRFDPISGFYPFSFEAEARKRRVLRSEDNARRKAWRLGRVDEPVDEQNDHLRSIMGK